MGVFLTAATTALSVVGQQNEAAAQRVELKVRKREEASAARDREVVRGRRFNALLGAQSAAAAAKGIQLSGSPANISLEDARRSSEESLIDRTNTEGRINALSRQATSIKRLANVKSATTILSGVQSIIDQNKNAAAAGGAP